MTTYVFGPDPTYYSDNQSKGNGCWKIQASDLEEAKQSVLPSLLFPGELAGRAGWSFLPGISLEGVHGDEVIQVWSDDPATIKRTYDIAHPMKITAAPKRSVGDIVIPDGHGLECEIKVIDLPNLFATWTRKLALPAPEVTTTSLSPMGSELGKAFASGPRQIEAFNRLRPQLELLILQNDLNLRSDRIEKEAVGVNQQHAIFQAYQAGGCQRRILASGDRASAGQPYWVFPERLYLSEEIALLMNLVDMDFRDMEGLYAWLTDGARWKKLLPSEKCILVTRMRKDRKKYADPLMGDIYNALNMEHLVWVRDGDFCAVLGCDLAMKDPILPPADFMQETLRSLQEKVWEKHFKPKEKTKPGLQKDALYVPAPYIPVQDPGLRKYPRFETWLKSPDYTSEIKEAVQQKMQVILIAHMRSQVPLLAYLQGLVDRGGILQIPSGTDMLGDQATKWLRLGNGCNTLQDPRARNAMEVLLSPKNVASGDWLLIRRGGKNSSEWSLVQVKGAVGDRFFVTWRPPKNNPYGWRSDDYTKSPRRVELEWSNVIWLPWDKLAPNVVSLLLDDRTWKGEHREMVPLLAKWDVLQSRVSRVNDTLIKLTDY